MYALIDGLCFLAGIVGIVAPIVYEKPAYSSLGVVWIGLYPFLNELVYNIGAKIGGQRVVFDIEPTSRLVYSDQYNLTLMGLQKLHPFDGSKYYNVVQKLIGEGIITKQDLIKPGRITRSFLLQKMSLCYLLKLCYTIPVCNVIEMPLYFLPAFLLRWRVLNPSLAMTEGSIVAATIAIKRRWAINIGGGLHHAHFNGGEGFCIYPDISLTVHYLQTRLSIGKVMVVDLDAHQGNGHQRDHLCNKQVYTVDCYNHGVYPADEVAKQAINKDLRISSVTRNEEFIQMVSHIVEDIKKFEPEFIIYNAGTDILEGDPLGKCNIKSKTIIQRDQIIFEMAISNKIPILMLLSGGYQLNNAGIIADSIQNLMAKFN